MASDHGDTWRPARLLDHLRSIRGRNLVLSDPNLDSTTYTFDLLVHQEPAATQQGQQKLYASEQVQGTCNPDWAPIDWPDKARGQLRTLSTVTLQVYAHHKTQAKRAVPGHVLSYDSSASVDGASSLAGADQDQTLVPQSEGNQEQAVSISTQTVAGSQAGDRQQSATQQPASDTLNQELQLSQPSAATIDHRFVPATRQDSHDSSDSGQDGAEANPSLSSQSIPECSLILTAEVNLDELNIFHQNLAALDVCLPPNTLVLELTEGLCLFPALDQAGASSDLAPLADTATANTPLLPGSSLPQHQSTATTAAADDNMPVQGSMSEQKARQHLAESLLHRPVAKSPSPTPVTPDITPELGRLRGLVKAKLGFAFGSGPDLAGLTSPHGASPEQHARLASSQQTSTSNRAFRSSKVDVQSLDAQMVALYRKQNSLQAVLQRQRELCQQLTQALQHRNTARQQRLRLDALRHGREMHQQRASACQESIQGSARSKDLAQAILRAQLQSLQHALQALKAAQRRLDSADVIMKGPQGDMKYRPLHAQLVGRRCRMATMLGHVFAIGPQTVTVCQAPPMGFLEDQMERGWWAGSDAGSSCSGSPKALIVTRRKQSAGAARNGFRQAALLTIGGLDLDPLLGKGSLDGIMNWEGDRQDMRRAAAALGYLAAAVERLGFYLDIPLRYPIKPGNCKSLILSHADVAGTYRLSMPIRLYPCLSVFLHVCVFGRLQYS
ncbi:TPA: hypothetical protein ACH3X2_005616 [Trebouxia sp. C0005]